VPSAAAGGEGEGEDELLEQAIAIVREQGTASASMLQRRLRIGYNRAARLIEALEAKGIIGPVQGKLRAVLEPEAGAGPAAGSGGKSDEELPL